jgi:DNA-directed RNA polymerase specialized sigma24 family protein
MSLEVDQRWSLTGPALDRLLRRLSEESDVDIRCYELVRLKLVGFFERRGFPGPDALADEVIDRVARRLEEGERVEHLKAYFYGVAKRVAMECARRPYVERAATERQRPLLDAETPEVRESRAACLERCLQGLPADSRRLIMGYYRCSRGERERLAESLHLSYACLKTRAHRIRNVLARCVRECLDCKVSVTDET